LVGCVQRTFRLGHGLVPLGVVFLVLGQLDQHVGIVEGRGQFGQWLQDSPVTVRFVDRSLGGCLVIPEVRRGKAFFELGKTFLTRIGVKDTPASRSVDAAIPLSVPSALPSVTLLHRLSQSFSTP